MRNFFLTLGLLLVLSGQMAIAGDPQLEAITTVPPESVPAAVKESLATPGVRVTVDGEVLGEFWMRKDLPTNEGANAGLSINFTTIPSSTLAGVVHFPEAWSDYKGQTIPGGWYSMRYEVEPSDGNHMGVSAYRDFLLLVPLSTDSDIDAKYTESQLVDLSRKASGTNHPAVLSLFPVHEEITEPKLVQNDIGQWTLAVPVGSVRLGLVLLGHGEGV